MTEKRFIIDDDEYIRDNTDFSSYLEFEDIVDLLNALHEELEQEKQKNRALKTVLGCTKMRLKKICEELE